jgi:hypothetical protein
MIFYIIIGHRSNKIQILLNIDDFFSFLSKKHKFIYLFYFLVIFFYCCFKNGVDKFPHPKKKSLTLNFDGKIIFYSPNARSAFSWKNFVKIIGQKLFRKKFFKKKNVKKISMNFFLPIFFWQSRFHIQFGVCLRKFGGSRLAGLAVKRIRTDST